MKKENEQEANVSGENDRPFSYEGLDENVLKMLRNAEEKIFGLLKKRLTEVIVVGMEFSRVKKEIHFGVFTWWLEMVAKKTGYSRRTFGNYMAVAERFDPESTLISELKLSKPVDQLGFLPTTAILLTSCTDEGLKEALRRADAGENITYKIAQEIQNRLPSTPKKKGKDVATNKESVTPSGKSVDAPAKDASNPEQGSVENAAVETKGEGTPSSEELAVTTTEGELAGESSELAQSAIAAKEIGTDECAIPIVQEGATSDSPAGQDDADPDPRVLQVNKTGEQYGAWIWNVWNIKEMDNEDAWSGPIKTTPPDSERQTDRNLLVPCDFKDKSKDEIEKLIQGIVWTATKAPQWNFVPVFLPDTDLPVMKCTKNLWPGIAVRTQDDFDKAVKSLKKVDSPVRFLRCNPTEKLDFAALQEGEIHWIILGTDAATSMDCIEEVYFQARRHGIKIHFNNGLVLCPMEQPVVEVDAA